ncbi:MAG: glycosyltransferase family 4 protein [Thermoplasmata archaeon]|nr:glycosyltransferase family 4 protein [Thermoplasmata archaeon]
MKVAIIAEWIEDYAGGVARHVRELANHLYKNGIDVSIITNNPEYIINDKKIFIVDGIREPFFKVNISPNLSRELKNRIRNFDLIHAHHAFSRLSLASISGASKLNIPSVLTTHTLSFFPDYEYFWQFLSYIYPRYRITISKTDRIIAVSNAAKKFISYFANKEAIVIPNGVDIKKFRPYNKKYARRKIGIEHDFPMILYIGRLVPRKGIDVLIFSMKKVVKKYPNAILFIAGKGKILPILKAMANLAGVEKNIKFLGYVDDKILPYLYSAADVFVLPSITGESFGIVLLEAMASGTPIVATKVGGIVEIIENEKNGIIVESGNTKETAKAILKILEDDRIRKNFSKKGRKMAEDRYSWDKIVKKTINVYEKLM